MKKKILVVDDSPTIRSTVGWLLASRGYDTQIASDGFTALSILNMYHPDLIVLDIRLEYIDGFELCALIRKQKRYSQTPIVMLSSLTAQKHIDHAFEMGATDYVPKPVADTKLMFTIEKHLAEQEEKIQEDSLKAKNPKSVKPKVS